MQVDVEEGAAKLSKRQRKRRARRARRAAAADLDDSFADALPVRYKFLAGAGKSADPAAVQAAACSLAAQDSAMLDVQRAFAKADRKVLQGGSLAAGRGPDALASSGPPIAACHTASGSVDPRVCSPVSTTKTSRPSQRPVQPLRVGDTVIVMNLLARPDLNGQEHNLVEFDATAGRWKVALPDGSYARIKPENLQICGPPAKRLHVAGGDAGCDL